MGVVYEAEQISLRRQVALKVLPFAATMDPRHLQRFHNEAQSAACLHHTNIVPVFSVGCERGVHFYAMQFIDGQPLSDLIRQLRERGKIASAPLGEVRTEAYHPAPDAVATPRPVAEMTPLTGEGRRGPDYYRKVVQLGVQAAEALDHAHQLGIVHRDIKPGNLLVDRRGNLWVTDFGLAHVRHSEASLTVSGQMVGTPRYMSPEQALARRVPIDHRTDVYSLGVTLYELLTLRPAFESEDRQELLHQNRLEGAGATSASEQGHSGGVGNHRAQGDGEAAAGPLCHRSGVGRRLAAVVARPTDPGAASVLDSGGTEVGAAAPIGRVGGVVAAVGPHDSRRRQRLVVDTEADESADGSAGGPSRGEALAAGGEMVRGSQRRSACARGSQRFRGRRRSATPD
jgi:serine/threonine protein kinase